MHTMISDSPNAPVGAAPMTRCLPPDDPLRVVLHDEVHARPPARVRLPALITYVAVLNDGVERSQECEHLRRLPGQQALDPVQLGGNFLRLRLGETSVKWERHTEFTRYVVLQPLPAGAALPAAQPDLLSALAVSPQWLSGIPGRTVAAVQLVLVEAEQDDVQMLLTQGLTWLGGRTLLASAMGNPAQDAAGPRDSGARSLRGMGHSLLMTQLRLRADGFERMLVVFPPGTSVTRTGRVAQRLLEIETYRLMALRGLPAAKALAPLLAHTEKTLADITASLESTTASDQQLLDALVALAARVERAIAENMYRFAATQAYHALVGERIAELRETPIPGTQTLDAFMRRRLSPAMATVAATRQRLSSLSERVARASDLLRTRVDIATEVQNQQLLAKLTRGQQLQLQLQTTVEGLSIAAISYYVISLLHYGGKALEALGLPVNPEMATGALVPVVLWAVWRTTQRIHARLHQRDAQGDRGAVSAP